MGYKTFYESTLTEYLIQEKVRTLSPEDDEVQKLKVELVTKAVDEGLGDKDGLEACFHTAFQRWTQGQPRSTGWIDYVKKTFSDLTWETTPRAPAWDVMGASRHVVAATREVAPTEPDDDYVPDEDDDPNEPGEQFEIDEVAQKKLRVDSESSELQAYSTWAPKRRIPGKTPVTVAQKETEKTDPEVKVTLRDETEEKDPDEAGQLDEVLPVEIQKDVAETDPKKLLTRAKSVASPVLVLKDREQILGEQAIRQNLAQAPARIRKVQQDREGQEHDRSRSRQRDPHPQDLSVEEVEPLLQAHAEVRLGQVLAEGHLTIEEYHQYKVLGSRIVIELVRHYQTGRSARQ